VILPHLFLTRFTTSAFCSGDTRQQITAQNTMHDNNEHVVYLL
jgi:hypothetical protein